MKLEKFRYDDVVILKFTGEFDTFNLPAFSERIDRMIEFGDTKLVLDMHLLTFINSAALGYLIKTHRTLATKKGEMVLARPSKFVRRTLGTLGLDTLFKVFETAEAAVTHFKSGTDVGQVRLEHPDADEAGLTGKVPLLWRLAEGGDGASQVGRIATLLQDGLEFRWDIPQPPKGDPKVADQLRSGARLKVKFRQPFVIKDYYFEMEVVVLEVKRSTAPDEAGTLQVRVRYDRVKDEDRERLEQFWRDQDEWKAQIKPR
jgi:anti-anti-sigma factor